MLSRLFLALALLLGGTGLSRAVHVVMCGGPALRQWEGLRIQPDRHDNWWANFVRASTIRIAQIHLDCLPPRLRNPGEGRRKTLHPLDCGPGFQV